ncbi:hypothetical protein ACFQ5F_12625 [Kroppenstedtia eburnea]
MIPFEIEYYKPASVAEALDTYHRLYSRTPGGNTRCITPGELS